MHEPLTVKLQRQLADAGDGVLPPDELGAVAQLHGLGRDDEHDIAGLEVVTSEPTASTMERSRRPSVMVAGSRMRPIASSSIDGWTSTQSSSGSTSGWLEARDSRGFTKLRD